MPKRKNILEHLDEFYQNADSVAAKLVFEHCAKLNRRIQKATIGSVLRRMGKRKSKTVGDTREAAPSEQVGS